MKIFGALIVVALSGCFSPTFPNGVLCAEGARCPGEQICASDNRCYDADAVPGDLVSPTVVLTSPLDTAEDVPVTVKIVATMSEPVDMSTASMVVTSSDGYEVEGVLTLENDGEAISFSPLQVLDPELAYEARIPATVADLAGNQLGMEVAWGFKITVGAWADPKLVESDLDRRVESLDVAQAGDKAIAAFLFRPCNGSLCEGETELWASTLVDGEWTSPAQVPTDATLVVGPKISINASGKALVTWYVPLGRLVNASYFDGVSWGQPQQVNEVGVDGQQPEVVLNDAGDGYAAWIDGSNSSLWANNFSSGNWGDATLLESLTPPVVSYHVTQTGNGDGLVVWGQDGSISSRRFVSTWEGVVSVGEGSTLTVTKRGSPLLIFANSSVQSTAFEDGWGPAKEIIAIGAGITFDSTRVRPGADGAVALVFSQGTNRDIRSARFDGSQWSSASAVEANSGAAVEPSIAVSGSGVMVAAWRQVSGPSESIWANYFVPGEGWRSPVLVEEVDDGFARTPKVLFDENRGGFSAIWVQSTIGFESLYQSRFE